MSNYCSHMTDIMEIHLFVPYFRVHRIFFLSTGAEDVFASFQYTETCFMLTVDGLNLKLVTDWEIHIG